MASLKNIIQDKNGNVSIGTISPVSGYKLDVRGNILAYYANVVAQGLVSGYGISEQKIGPDGTSASNKPFVVYTSGGFTNERLRIDTSGNVGIGTTSPKAHLHINDGGTYNNTDANNRLFIERDDHAYILMSTPDNKDQGIHFRNTTDNANVGRIAYQHRSTGDSLHFRVGSTSDTNEFLIINSDGTVQIKGYGAGVLTTDSAGNVGVSTGYQTQSTADGRYVNVTGDTMTGQLIIQNTGNFTAAKFKGTDANGYGSISIENDLGTALVLGSMGSTNTGTFFDNARYIGATSGELVLKTYSSTDGHIKFLSGGQNERMRIDKGGNVGIGTTGPAFKLQVATPAVASGSDYAWSFDLTRADSTFRGFSIGQGSGGGTVAMGGHNTDIAIGHTFGTDSNGNPAFYETMRIQHVDQAVGNVGIGTTAPSDKLEVKDGSIRVTTLNSFSNLISGRSAIPNAGGYNLGGLLFQAYSTGTTYTTGAAIYSYADGAAWTSTSVPSYLSFHTAASGATSTTERMVINSSGNVGIGTTGPNYPIDLQKTTSPLTLNLKLNKASTTNDYAEIAFQLWSGAGSGENTFGGTGTSRPSVVLRAINENGGSAAGALVVGTFTGGANNSNLTEKFRITSAGNVGIGTTNPTYKLHVDDNNAYGGILIEGDNAPGLSIRDNSGTSLSKIYVQSTSSSQGNLRISSDDNNTATTPTIEFIIGGSDKMRIVDNGNVGIGTTSPSAKLDVDGYARFAKQYREGGFSALGATVDDWYTIADFSLNSATYTYDNFKGTVNWGYGGATSWYAVEFDVYFRGNNSIAADGAYVRWSYRQTGNAEGKGGSAIRIVRSDDVTYEIQISPIANYGVVNWEVVSPKYSSAITLTTYDTIQTASTALSSSNIVQDSNFYVNGNVGIGTTNPGAKLTIVSGGKGIHVDKGSHSSTSANLSECRTNYGFAYDTLRNGSTTGFFITNVGTNTPAMQAVDSSNNAQNISIQPYGGNVGIGETDPKAKLNITGVSGGPTVPVASSSDGIVRIESSNGGVGLDIGAQGASPYSMWMQVGNTSNSSGDTYPILLNPLGGNVGIGTTGPDQNLHINSSSASITGIAVTNTSTGASRLYLDASNGDLAGGDYMWIGQNNDLSGEIVMTQSAGAFHIKTQPGGTITSRLTVLQDGNVGIGTTSPSEKLHIGSGTVPAATLDGVLLTLGTSQYYQASDGTKSVFMGVDNSSYGIVGMLTNHPLGFRTDNTERMRILANGNVGIGTTNPGVELDVAGGIRATAGTANGLRVHTNSGITASNNYMNFFTSQSSGWAFNANGTGADSTTKVVITSGGNVGIGTTSPTQKLQVGASTDTISYARWVSTTADLYVGANSTATHIGVTNGAKILQTGSYPLVIGTTANQELYLGANNAIIATLVDGKMGIGTTSPSEKLEVTGNVIRVNSDAGGFYQYTSAGVFRSAFYDNGTVTQIYADGNGSTPVMTFNSGKVGIGTTAPQQALHIKGATNGLMMLEGDNDNGIAGCYYKTEDTDDTMNRTKGFFGFQGNNTWGLGYFTMWLDNVGDNGTVTASEERFRWERDGDFHADGDVIAYSTTTPSDIRLKTDIETIESASEKVSKLRGVEYTWSKGKLAGQREIGLIAQEVEAVVPEVVKEKKLPLWDDSGESYKTVDYDKLVALLIESNKEMQEEIKQLKERLDGFTK